MKKDNTNQWIILWYVQMSGSRETRKKNRTLAYIKIELKEKNKK